MWCLKGLEFERSKFLMYPEFWPYLVGLVPILFARSWPARVVAILFGLVSIGFGVYYVWSIHNGADITTGVQQAGRAIIGALSIAVVLSDCDVFLNKNLRRERRHQMKKRFVTLLLLSCITAFASNPIPSELRNGLKIKIQKTRLRQTSAFSLMIWGKNLQSCVTTKA